MRHLLNVFIEIALSERSTGWYRDELIFCFFFSFFIMCLVVARSNEWHRSQGNFPQGSTVLLRGMCWITAAQAQFPALGQQSLPVAVRPCNPTTITQLQTLCQDTVVTQHCVSVPPCQQDWRTQIAEEEKRQRTRKLVNIQNKFTLKHILYIYSRKKMFLLFYILLFYIPHLPFLWAVIYLVQAWLLYLRTGSLRVLCRILAVPRILLFWTEIRRHWTPLLTSERRAELGTWRMHVFATVSPTPAWRCLRFRAWCYSDVIPGICWSQSHSLGFDALSASITTGTTDAFMPHIFFQLLFQPLVFVKVLVFLLPHFTTTWDCDI